MVTLLQDLGLSQNEAAIYLACLELGESPASKIAVKSELPRTYVYDILRSLSKKGLVTSVVRKSATKFAAVEPERLKKIYAEKLRRLDEALPLLTALHQGAGERPQVRFFEGKEGMKAIHDEALAESREIEIFGSTEDWVGQFADWEVYMKGLVRKRIKIKDLVKRMPATERYKRLYHAPNQEMRFTKEGWEFECDIALSGNKVAMLSYGEDMHGILIESGPIAQTLRSVFRILWEQAEQ